MSTDTVFFVSGIPRPQGSKSFVRGRVIEASRYVHQWREDIASLALDAYSAEPTETPVSVTLQFTFARPKSHCYASGDLKPSAKSEHLQRPDVDKLSRAVLDALTGILYQDDSQVISLLATKQWGEVNGVRVTVSSG